jgi:monofunctional biosynthetic peptidoglycan transglycosylase
MQVKLRPVRSFLRWLRRWTLRLGIGVVIGTLVLVLPGRWLPPPGSSVMVQRAWEAERWPDYRWVEGAAIADAARLAVLAAEDQRFPDHRGFDLAAIGEAVADFLDGGRLRGASTLTQQVARNLFLWQGRSLVRKGLEAWFTVWIELLWSKPRILEVYLNIAETGPETFGIEAAAWRYFARSARELTAGQAALIAAVLPNPVRFRADKPSAHVRERRAWILRQMRQLGGEGYLARLR